jgi:hypothetical protein
MIKIANYLNTTTFNLTARNNNSNQLFAT